MFKKVRNSPVAGGVIALALLFAVLGGMVWTWDYSKGLTTWGLEVNLDTSRAITKAEEPMASTSPSAEPEVFVTPSAEPEETAEVIVDNEIVAYDMMIQAGFTPSDFVVGDAVDPALDMGTTGPRSFSHDGVYTAEEQVEFLKSGTPEGDAILASVIEGTSTKGYPTTKEDVLDASNWTTVQFTVPVYWTCNSGFDAANNSIKESDAHADQASSVLAVYIPKEQAASGELKLAYGTRGACNNPQDCMPTKIPPTEKPTPKPTPPSTPEPSVTPTPPVPLCPDGPEEGQPVGDDGVCEKDPTSDVLVNPDVPDQVKGEGTTPVGQDPGPAEDPIDSPTGCDGSCDGQDDSSGTFTPPSATPAPTAPPEVQDPDPVIPEVTASPTPTQTGDPATTCDKDGDGIPDDNCS